ncbi:MAG: Smr/MutS family protein, partial [Paraprevotella sp.]|nr:Smr/MutS family protein [Paraprevotella sp.]
RNEKKAAQHNTTDELQQKAKEAALNDEPLKTGDTVRIKGQTTVGTIDEIDGKHAIVTFGMMRTNIKVDRLERAVRPLQKETPQAATYVSKQTQDAVYEKKLSFKQDIDVRGMRGEEAINAVTYFIDDAILVGMSRVRILHGTGNGILRTLIRQYLHTLSGVKAFKDEHVQFGGAGITVVDLF